MAFTLQQLNLLCQYSYGVNRADVLTTPGKHDFNVPQAGSFWIAESQYDHDSGFEGMIATPIHSDGQLDYAHIVVVFAGFNFKDDAYHDTCSIFNILYPSRRQPVRQVIQAERLVQLASNLSRDHGYDTSTILLTGHSLGGCLALICALRNNATAKTFCALDPWPLLTATEATNIRSAIESEQLVDYRLSKDLLTNPVNRLLSGETNRSAKVIWCGQGNKPPYHWLGDFTFDASGHLLTQKHDPTPPRKSHWYPIDWQRLHSKLLVISKRMRAPFARIKALISIASR
ncbi:lipase family protein [Bombiscardovia coagulans]|uniref:Protein with lipase (Class 3) domain n=1 Tax=Bombiscardovia coagulans TaxID=686666 RepID=A0A261EUU5_9BIFI|nr:hypothetical protein [Bombiscardovia coagulans]OZG50607.1 protein with lipase (class 3) domain [Bombiscardovia coagulans]